MPQGLAVYQNGVRINEAFGDIVNWDFLPDNAINGIAVIGANPVFGLNALGGAISVTMRDGFNYPGRRHRYARRLVRPQAGQHRGWARRAACAVYGAFEGIDDDGFRDFSESEIRRGYADIGIRKATNAEFHFNFTGAQQLRRRHGRGARSSFLDLGCRPDLHLAADDRQRAADVFAQRHGASDDRHHAFRRHLLPAFQAGSSGRKYFR